MPAGGALDGKDAFTLYDTYGFPLDLTQDALRARGIGVDIASFTDAMEQPIKDGTAEHDQIMGLLDELLNQKPGGPGFDGTDTETSLQRYTDVRVVAVPGSPLNLKITFPEDVALAARLVAASR